MRGFKVLNFLGLVAKQVMIESVQQMVLLLMRFRREGYGRLKGQEIVESNEMFLA
jgi:hypothetical protein